MKQVKLWKHLSCLLIITDCCSHQQRHNVALVRTNQYHRGRWWKCVQGTSEVCGFAVLLIMLEAFVSTVFKTDLHLFKSEKKYLAMYVSLLYSYLRVISPLATSCRLIF